MASSETCKNAEEFKNIFLNVVENIIKSKTEIFGKIVHGNILPNWRTMMLEK